MSKIYKMKIINIKIANLEIGGLFENTEIKLQLQNYFITLLYCNDKIPG